MRYLTPHDRLHVLADLYNLGLNREIVHHVPIIEYNKSLQELGILDTKGLLEFAKGKSLNADIREGVVFKRIDGEFSFKSINNDWLLKHE
jgi:hypothetical protein